MCRWINKVVLLLFMCVSVSCVSSSHSTKKELKMNAVTALPPRKAAAIVPQPEDGAAEEPVVVISERTLQEMQQQKAETAANVKQKQPPNANEEAIILHNPDDTDISESYETVFYFLLALSIAGIAIFMVKIYRMRLTRAERKYGVQGDRSTQELTPLPISIENGNSDDEDQTLFEINRQQIRIL